jgi:CTP:molybdopterin cytidylyltransferase MocA
MKQHDRVAAVILAAGESRRFGSPKQLAQLDGQTLLEHVLQRAATAGLIPIVAVVPVWLTRPAAMDDPRLRWIRNPYPERGMSHSLQLGFAALPPEVGAAIILLGDQPRVSTAHLAAIIAARGSRPLIATRVGTRLVPPVLIERSRFPLVDQPRGDVGLREILAAVPDEVQAVDAAEPMPDVDTLADLDAVRDG